MKKYVLLVASLLAGCAAMQPLSKGGTLILSPRIQTGAFTQADRTPYTKDTINHLVLDLHPLVDGVPQSRIAQRVLTRLQLDNPVVISALKAHTSYRIYPYAYATEDDTGLISRTSAAFYTDIAVDNDNAPTLAALNVELLDQVFDGQATASGLAINPGGYAATGSEAVIPLTQSLMAVTTVAGYGTVTGYGDGTGARAQFAYPFGILYGNDGNLYVADEGNHRIRKVSSSGVVSTIAGLNNYGYGSDGTASAICLYGPTGIAMDASGSLYFAENGAHRIRRITPEGQISTYAGSGGQGSSDGDWYAAQFLYPRGIAFDKDGNLYVADGSNHKIRMVAPDRTVSTIAGNGTSGTADGMGTLAQFYFPYSLAIDSEGNIYVADASNYRVRKIAPDRSVTTLAGSTSGYKDGTGTAAQFGNVNGIVLAQDGNLYVTDSSYSRIRRVTLDGVVTTVAGYGSSGWADGLGPNALFSNSKGLTQDPAGNFYVTDVASIRKLRWLSQP